MGLFGKTALSVKYLYDEVILYWSKPARGNFVSYREVLNLGIGGMGQQLVILMTNYMGLAATNTLLGSTLGIAPIHLQVMSTIQTLLGILFTILRGKIIDNTRTRIGRFRPYIAITGIPLAVLTGVFVFLPFETFSYTAKLTATFCFTLAVGFCSPFLTDSYNNLISVITPRAEERTKIVTINTFLFSVAPTITGFAVPLFAGLFQGTYTNISLYRYVIVPIGILGVGLNLFAAFGTKERVITSNAKPLKKVHIWRDTASIFKNKYWWILNIAGVIGFTEGAFGVILNWVFIYELQNMAAYSLANTIMGTAASIGMFVAPFLLLRFGNKKVLLGHNILNIFMIIGMMINYSNPILFFVFYYLNTIIQSLALIYNVELNAEMKDYQQFRYRKRLDQTFSVAGLLLMPLTLLTGYFMPFVYESFGLTTNYNILYDSMVRDSLFYIVCALSVIGAVLNLIPYFFFDMSAEKHKWIMNSIRLRSAAADRAAGKITARETKEICEILDEYEYLCTAEFDVPAAKVAWKSAKKRKAPHDEIRELKKAYRKCRRQAAEKKELHYFDEELQYFESDRIQRKLQFCRLVCRHPVEAYLTLSDGELKTIADAADPKTAKKFRKAVKALRKYTAGQLREMEQCLNTVNAQTPDQQDKRQVRLARKYLELVEFHGECDGHLRECDAMEHFFDIRTEYASACAAVEEEERQAEEHRDAENAAKAAEKAQRKAERKQKRR